MQTDQYECKRVGNTVDVLIVVFLPQDQIDTLTFQNQSLKAKADRFEEALKKNTEEQLKVDDNSNYTGIKTHVSKYYTSPNSMKSNGILTPGTGGRSQLRPQILSSEEESQLLAKGVSRRKFRGQMGCRGPGPGSFHTTDSPKPQGSIKESPSYGIRCIYG